MCFEVSLARRQNLKLAWEDAWNHEKMELSVNSLRSGITYRYRTDLLGHDAVTYVHMHMYMRRASGESYYNGESAVS